MRISKLQFYFILFLIFLLPLSSGWKLFLFGEKTIGKVVGYNPNFGLYYPTNGSSKQSIIRFNTKAGIFDVAGPDDIIYPFGKELTIYYNPKNPKKNLLFNIYGLFLTQKMILPGVLLLLWVAFYLTVNQNKQKPKLKSKMDRYWQNIEKL
jgi:hypothetical protein